MTKRKKISSRVSESVDPMTAFVENTEELEMTEEKPAEEKPAEEKPAEEKPAEEKPAEEKPAEEKPAEEKPAEEKDVFEVLHGKSKKQEKNKLPIQLINETEQEKPKVTENAGVGRMYDLLEVARQHAIGYQSTWDASIKAYTRHMGFPNLASLEDCKAFLVKWGAKLKD